MGIGLEHYTPGLKMDPTPALVGFMYVYVFMYSMYLMYVIIVDELTKQIPNN